MVCHDRGESWFLVQLKPNSAHIAERNLQRQGFRTFLPLEQRTEKRNNRFVTIERPLFPGYIFASLEAGGGLWRSVNSTHGVTRLVSFGKEPAAVPAQLIAELMQRCDSRGRLLPPELLQPGDQVTLTTGPFASFVAEVERIAPDPRVWVLMEFMGGQARVAVEANQLRVAPALDQDHRSQPVK